VLEQSPPGNHGRGQAVFVERQRRRFALCASPSRHWPSARRFMPSPMASAQRTAVGAFLDDELPRARGRAPPAGSAQGACFPSLSFDNPTFIVAQPRSDRLCVGSPAGCQFIRWSTAPARRPRRCSWISQTSRQEPMNSGTPGFRLPSRLRFGSLAKPANALTSPYSLSPEPVNDVNAPSTTPSYNRLSALHRAGWSGGSGPVLSWC